VIIYCIENQITKKRYIGYSTKYNSNREFQKSKYWGSGIYIKKAIEKYGIENFKKWVLLKNIFNFNELKKYESLWIKKLNTKPPNGYNISDGGDGPTGIKQSQEHIKKRMESKKWYKLSKETIELIQSKRKMKNYGKLISIKLKGKNKPKHSKEQNTAQSLRMMGHSVSEKTKKRMRHPRSEQGRNNIRESHKNRIRLYKRICISCHSEFISKGNGKWCNLCKDKKIKYLNSEKWKKIKKIKKSEISKNNWIKRKLKMSSSFINTLEEVKK
jgi:hypothetical protein